MVQTSILDDARRLRLATKEGTIRAGQQYSMSEFAHLAKITRKGAKRLLDVWQILRDVGVYIEVTEIKTQGGTPRYAVRVAGNTSPEDIKGG